MGTDDIFKKERAERRQRKTASREPNPCRFLIVCEGESTEPKYFYGIKEYLTRMGADAIDIDVYGTGRNTISLVKETERIIDDIERRVTLSVRPYGNIWVIFDRDDFTPDQFNRAIFLAESKGWKVGWSNECIELWFLLHFDFLQSKINRSAYFDRLSDIFKKAGIADKYEKNMDNIYTVIRDKTCVAVKNSQALYEKHGTHERHSQKNPATTIFKLIQEIEKQSGVSL
jgi:hypothetical protein